MNKTYQVLVENNSGNWFKHFTDLKKAKVFFKKLHSKATLFVEKELGNQKIITKLASK